MENKDFLDYIKEERSDFVKYISSLPWDSKLRTKIDSLIIAYDQMYYKLKDED